MGINGSSKATKLDMILRIVILVLCTLCGVFGNDGAYLRECKNTKIERDVTLKGGIGAGTFRKLGKVTRMGSCIELCCKTPTCDVAFLSSSKCYGVECVSDEECQSTATDTSDRRALIAHVRTGHKKENTSLALERATQHPVIGADAKNRLLAQQQGASLSPATGPVLPNANANPNANINANANAISSTNINSAKALITQGTDVSNPSMAGQCKPGKIYKEVTLKGGINAGTYKDVGEVASIDDCSKRCCDYSACDVAFMLQKRCYLVGCSEGKNCKFQKAKPSPYHPSLMYVTRWNSEGVKHALFVEDEENTKSVCNPMKVLTKVTLKGGLKAGDFTDTGKAGSIGDCYDICCKQSTCDLAFMLGQNCFSVKCYNNDLCSTTKAQPSIFNPQIAYVSSRKTITSPPILPAAAPKEQVTKPDGKCPKGEIIEKVTLVGGINAGSFRDHGKIQNMNLCRRICCEMTKCNLAFMLGGSCFSVECKTENACKTQPSNPSQFFPKVSYVRNFGSSSIIGADTAQEMSNQRNLVPLQPASPLEKFVPQPAAKQLLAQFAHPPQQPIQSAKSPFEQSFSSKVQSVGLSMSDALRMNEPFMDGSLAPSAQNEPSQSAHPSQPTQSVKPIQLPEPAQPVQPAQPAQPAQLVLPMQAAQSETTETSTIKTVVTKPPADKEPEATKSKSKPDVKEQIKSAGAGQAMTMSLVNGKLQLTPVGEESGDGSGKTKGHGSETSGAFDAILGGVHNKDSCKKVEVVSDVTLKGGKSAGKFKDHGDVKSMDTCQELCCKQKNCNIAFMLGKTCYSVTCKDKESCQHTPAPPSNFNPRLAYVRPAEEESHKDSDEAPPLPKDPKDLSCKHSNITNDKKLSGPIHKKNYTLTKDVDNMGDCMRKCCDNDKCDVAYFLEKKCYQVSCSNKAACRPLLTKASKNSPLMSAMMMRPKPDKATELEVQPNPVEKSSAQETTGFSLGGSGCQKSRVSTGVRLKGGKQAGNFTDLGPVNSLQMCIEKCCILPSCDIAYLENMKCFAVRCYDGVLCQTSAEKVPAKDNVQLAYMNRNGVVEKDRDWMIIYIIVGSLAFVAVIGGAIWAACICAKRQQIGKQRRLVEEEDEDDVMLPKPTQTRYRSPMQRY